MAFVSCYGLQLVLEVLHTGAIAASSVSSSTFSMADFFGLRGGGGTRVGRFAMIAAALVRKPLRRELVKSCFATRELKLVRLV